MGVWYTVWYTFILQFRLQMFSLFPVFLVTYFSFTFGLFITWLSCILCVVPPGGDTVHGGVQHPWVDVGWHDSADPDTETSRSWSLLEEGHLSTAAAPSRRPQFCRKKHLYCVWTGSPNWMLHVGLPISRKYFKKLTSDYGNAETANV